MIENIKETTAAQEEVIKYRCDAGHEMQWPGFYSALRVESHPGDIARNYNFCMECWGVWAAERWPLRQAAD